MPDAPVSSTMTQLVPKQGRDALAAITKGITDQLSTLPDSERPKALPKPDPAQPAPETKPPAEAPKPKAEKVDVSKQVDAILKDSKLPISLTKEPAKEMKAEPAPESDDNEPLPEAFTKASPKVQEHFKSLKTERNKLAKERDEIRAEVEAKAKRAAELEAKMKELEGRAAPADYEQIKREREAYHNQLLMLDTLNHPEVRAKYEGQLKLSIDTATAYMDDSDRAKVSDVLKMPESRQKQQALNELIGTLDDMGRMSVLTSAAEIRRLNLERESLGKSAEANRARQVEMAQQEQRHRQQQFEKVIETALGKTDAPGMEVYQEMEGNDDWNAEVVNRKKLAKKLFMGGFTPEESAEFAAKAAAFDRVYHNSGKKDEAIGKLVKLIESLQGASPGMVASGGTQKPTKPMTYQEHLLKIASGGEE